MSRTSSPNSAYRVKRMVIIMYFLEFIFFCNDFWKGVLKLEKVMMLELVRERLGGEGEALSVESVEDCII